MERNIKTGRGERERQKGHTIEIVHCIQIDRQRDRGGRRTCRLVPKEMLALIILVWLISLQADLWPPHPFSSWTGNYTPQQCLSIELV